MTALGLVRTRATTAPCATCGHETAEGEAWLKHLVRRVRQITTCPRWVPRDISSMHIHGPCGCADISHRH